MFLSYGLRLSAKKKKKNWQQLLLRLTITTLVGLVPHQLLFSHNVNRFLIFLIEIKGLSFQSLNWYLVDSLFNFQYLLFNFQTNKRMGKLVKNQTTISRTNLKRPHSRYPHYIPKSEQTAVVPKKKKYKKSKLLMRILQK